MAVGFAKSDEVAQLQCECFAGAGKRYAYRIVLIICAQQVFLQVFAHQKTGGTQEFANVLLNGDIAHREEKTPFLTAKSDRNRLYECFFHVGDMAKVSLFRLILNSMAGLFLTFLFWLPSLV